MSTPPGDATAWFWTFDCASDCNATIVSPEVAVYYGVDLGDSQPAIEFGVGVSGWSPYAQTYFQLRRGPSPMGVGGRVGLNRRGWHEDAVFGRFDVALDSRRTLILVPTVLRHSSRHAANPGSFTAIAQGVGVRFKSDFGAVSPLALLVLGHTSRQSSLSGPVSGVAAFAVFGVTLTFGGLDPER